MSDVTFKDTPNDSGTDNELNNSSKTSEPVKITMNNYMCKIGEKAKLALTSEENPLPEVGILISVFESMCNSILIFVESFLNFLVLIVSKTNIGKKILKLFINVWLTYGEFGIVSATYANHCIEKENKSFYSNIKAFPDKFYQLLINFNDKISDYYQPFIKEKYDSLV